MSESDWMTTGPRIAGVGGGSGSGKTTLIQEIVTAIGEDLVNVISHDAYYKDLRHLSPAERSVRNFDHPGSLDTELLISHIEQLKRGNEILVPIYDFSTHTRSDGSKRMSPKRLLIVDGIMALANRRLRNMMDLRIYVQTSEDVRRARRMRRDTRQRGRTAESVIRQFTETVKPMHDLHVEPTRAYADVVVAGDHRRHSTRTAAFDAVRALLTLPPPPNPSDEVERA